MSTPEEIQRSIERTRASLSTDVNRLNEKVSPARVVGRRVESVKGTATSVKERIMGSAQDGASTAASSVSDAASSVGDVASAAPQAVRRQTQGNPMAAGVIAFGIGWLLSSLPPATQREQDVAALVEDKAKELAEPLKETAQEMAGNLQEPLQHSVEQVKSAATDAATQTADQARSSAADIKEPLQ